jgi:hypothetical protein
MLLDNFKGRNTKRPMPTRKKGCAHQYLVFGVLKGLQDDSETRSRLTRKKNPRVRADNKLAWRSN